jgi:hypothetical protein
MGNKSAKSAWAKWDAQYSDSYIGAGCMFVDERTCLVGIQQKDRKNIISGFGGKCLTNEHWRVTAFRETIEEMFHIFKIPTALLAELERTLIPAKVLSSEGYITLVYTFKQLRMFLRNCKKHLVTSPLYYKFPTDVQSLQNNRRIVPNECEVSHILLWPRYFEGTRYKISNDFISDLVQLNHNIRLTEYDIIEKVIVQEV